MADMRACNKCNIVNDKVGLFYHQKPVPPEYLCIECQKQAFRFGVFITILHFWGNEKYTPEDRVTGLTAAVGEFARQNRITQDYWMKLVTREINKIVKGDKDDRK